MPRHLRRGLGLCWGEEIDDLGDVLGGVLTLHVGVGTQRRKAVFQFGEGRCSRAAPRASACASLQIENDILGWIRDTDEDVALRGGVEGFDVVAHLPGN